jgi:hypothetical protein
MHDDRITVVVPNCAVRTPVELGGRVSATPGVERHLLPGVEAESVWHGVGVIRLVLDRPPGQIQGITPGVFEDDVLVILVLVIVPLSIRVNLGDDE